MKVRELKKEDKFEAGKLSAICFHSRIDDLDKQREEWEQDKSEDWGAFTGDELIARIINNHFISYINGVEIKNGGIGGVSTLPEYRNMGAVREIFNCLLPKCYENGEVISTLAPFNFAFYRKFGYEVCCAQNIYTFSVDTLKDYVFDGEVKMFQDGDSVEDYTELYSEFIKKYNLGMKRSNEQMNYHVKRNVFKRRVFSYLFKKNGKPISYIFLKDEWGKDAATMIIKEAVWNSKEGFEAILGFIARFSADYKMVKLYLPSNLEFYSIIHTWKGYEISKEVVNSYMVRAINAKRLLELIAIPNKESFNIKINDEIINENNKTFKVSSTSVIETNEDYDLLLSIQTFSLLLTNAVSFDEASLRDGFELKNKSKEDLFKSCFVRKPIMKTEEF